MVLLMLLFTGCKNKEVINNISFNSSDTINYNITMKRDLLCLMMAYPEHITDIEHGKDGYVYIVMKSGDKIIYDDKKVKNFKEKLSNPDLQDMLEQIYPNTDIKNIMKEDFDPGRIRHYKLLKEIYGSTKEQIQSNLTNIKVGYKYCLFNNNNKAAESLKAVMKELIPLAQKRSDIYSCVFPTSGTFNYRLISGTNRLSAHSFGIAIDLARDKRDYWKWTSKEDGEKRLNKYPREIIHIFEKNNFIWGGKWNHFDILHFEYRPEFILKSRYFSNKPINGKPWHDGLPSIDENVQKYIQLINTKLK